MYNNTTSPAQCPNRSTWGNLLNSFCAPILPNQSILWFIICISSFQSLCYFRKHRTTLPFQISSVLINLFFGHTAVTRYLEHHRNTPCIPPLAYDYPLFFLLSLSLSPSAINLIGGELGWWLNARQPRDCVVKNKLELIAFSIFDRIAFHGDEGILDGLHMLMEMYQRRRVARVMTPKASNLIKSLTQKLAHQHIPALLSDHAEIDIIDQINRQIYTAKPLLHQQPYHTYQLIDQNINGWLPDLALSTNYLTRRQSVDLLSSDFLRLRPTSTKPIITAIALTLQYQLNLRDSSASPIPLGSKCAGIIKQFLDPKSIAHLNCASKQTQLGRHSHLWPISSQRIARFVDKKIHACMRRLWDAASLHPHRNIAGELTVRQYLDRDDQLNLCLSSSSLHPVRYNQSHSDSVDLDRLVEHCAGKTNNFLTPKALPR